MGDQKQTMVFSTDTQLVDTSKFTVNEYNHYVTGYNEVTGEYNRLTSQYNAMKAKDTKAFNKLTSQYEPLTNVTEHSEIDLDLINIMDNLGETCGASCLLRPTCPATSSAADGTGCGYDGSTMKFPSGTTCQWGDDKELDSGTCNATSNAYDIWLHGQNSEKSSVMRKISDFAKKGCNKR